jgi:prepilin-type N-terminal cleavage/methylation domain-containing protein
MISKRSGYTLVEMLVVIAMTTLLLGLCAGLIHTLVGVDRGGRSHLAEAESLARLARQFRADVRAAIAVAPSAGEPGRGIPLELALPEQRRVAYRVDASAVVRVVQQEGHARRQDRFRLPRRSAARLMVERDHGATIVSLVFDRELGPSGSAALRASRIDAALGRDHRFEGGGGKP